MLVSLITTALLVPRESELRQAMPPIEDTFVDQTLPDVNFGRELVLVGGPNKAILIRFPELNYNSTTPRKVKSAKLVFTSNGGPVNVPSKISQMKVRWGEGPGRGENKAIKPVGSATWNAARFGDGGQRWDSGGAGGEQDARTVTLQSSVEESKLVITGLESIVQGWIDDRSTNFGLRLQFDQATVLKSAEHLEGRPELQVEYEPVATGSVDLAVTSLAPNSNGTSWVATIKNVGTTETGGRVTWIVNDKTVNTAEMGTTIAPGQTQTVSLPLPITPTTKDQRSNWIAARVTASSEDFFIANNGLEVPVLGVPIKIAGGDADPLKYQDLIREVNDHILAQSRSSFALDGSQVRIRLAGEGETAATAQLEGDTRKSQLTSIVRALIPVGQFAVPPSGIFPYPTNIESHFGWFSDTRDDTGRIAALPMPALYWMPRISDDFNYPLSGLLSMGEQAILQYGLGKPHSEWIGGVQNMPKTVVLRCFDANAIPLANADIKVFQIAGDRLSAEPVYTLKTTRQGSTFLPSRVVGEAPGTPFGKVNPDGSNGWLLIQATLNGMTDSMWLPASALWAEHSRGNVGTATIECRFMLAPLTVDENENLALNKIVTDSKGRFPAELSALVDGNPATSVKFEQSDAPYWIEIDLGKDRTFCQIELCYSDGLWEQFDIVTYNTTQSAASGFAWIREFGGTWQAQMRGKVVDGQSVIVYRANPNQTRYIRIVPKTDRNVSLSEIRIRPIAASN